PQAEGLRLLLARMIASGDDSRRVHAAALGPAAPIAVRIGRVYEHPGLRCTSSGKHRKQAYQRDSEFQSGRPRPGRRPRGRRRAQPPRLAWSRSTARNTSMATCNETMELPRTPNARNEKGKEWVSG